MSNQIRLAAPIGAILLVTGCVTPPSSKPPPAVHHTPRPPSYSIVGLESAMGKDRDALEAAFGKPSLDIREGEARKLQFAGTVCVLDAYLYPRKQGEKPVVTYIDTRLPDGRDVDRASCVAALIRHEEAK